MKDKYILIAHSHRKKHIPGTVFYYVNGGLEGELMMHSARNMAERFNSTAQARAHIPKMKKAYPGLFLWKAERVKD